MLPTSVIAVSESGLKTAGDLQSMTALGYRAFLIGERFMTDTAIRAPRSAGLIASTQGVTP